MHVYVHIYGRPKVSIRWVPQCCLPSLRQGVSLAWHPPGRLGWLTSKPWASAVFSVLGFQTYTTMSRFFSCILEIKLSSSCLCGKRGIVIMSCCLSLLKTRCKRPSYQEKYGRKGTKGTECFWLPTYNSIMAIDCSGKDLPWWCPYLLLGSKITKNPLSPYCLHGEDEERSGLIIMSTRKLEVIPEIRSRYNYQFPWPVFRV